MNEKRNAWDVFFWKDVFGDSKPLACTQQLNKVNVLKCAKISQLQIIISSIEPGAQY